MNNKRKIPQSAKQRQEAVVNKPKRENLKKKLIEKQQREKKLMEELRGDTIIHVEF